MPHTIAIRSKDNSRLDYRISVSGDIAARTGITGEDSAHNSVAEGSVGGGVDVWDYSGARTEIVVSSASAQLSINGGAWTDGEKFGEVVVREPSGGSSGGSSGNGGGGAPSPPEPGGGTSLRERKEDAAGRDGVGSVRVLGSGDEFRSQIESVPYPMEDAHRFVVPDGTHHAGTVQQSVGTVGGAPVLAVVGNTGNPYACDVRGNQNYVLGVVKDEHFRVEGMTWGRTQFAGNGDPYVRSMVFTDRHGKGHSALGGKRACGRFIDVDVGHRDDPDEYAAYYFGGGEVLFDRGNTFRATGDAYIGASNHVTINIGRNNEFASGRKEVVEGSGVYPGDLTQQVTTIKNGRKI